MTHGASRKYLVEAHHVRLRAYVFPDMLSTFLEGIKQAVGDLDAQHAERLRVEVNRHGVFVEGTLKSPGGAELRALTERLEAHGFTPSKMGAS